MMNMPDNLYVTNSEYLSGYTIRIFFSDGTVNDVDFADFLYNHPHPQYDKYRELSKFKKYEICNGDIHWGKDWDLCFPIENLYMNELEHCYEYEY